MEWGEGVEGSGGEGKEVGGVRGGVGHFILFFCDLRRKQRGSVSKK